MSETKDIVDIAKAFLASNIDLGDEGEMRTIVQSLILAVEGLEKEVAKANEVNCMGCTVGMDAEAALKEIRSLAHSSLHNEQ